MRFKIDWASRILGSKSTVFALFYFVFEGNFASTSPPGGGGGAYIWRGDLTEVFCVTGLGGLYMEGLNCGILRYFSGSRAPSQRIYLENWPCILYSVI